MTVTIQAWMFWCLVAFATFLVGLIIGVVAGRRSNAYMRRAKQLQVELEETRDQLAEYREKVTRHFARTSDLFNTLTNNYKSVYQHLAEGCHELCGDKVPKLTLEMPVERLPGEDRRKTSPQKVEQDESPEARAEPQARTDTSEPLSRPLQES